MTQEALQMHGSMFFLLNQFIVRNYGNDVWLQLTKTAGAFESPHDIHKNYPAAEMFAILNAASQLTQLSENDLKEKFGEYLVPTLLSMYKQHVNPEWKTFQMLENTELVMHKAVRKQENQAAPPILNISRVHDKLLIIDYYSKRKMASLAVGIINGIAKYYGESDKVEVIPVTNPDDERVQIRVEFS